MGGAGRAPQGKPAAQRAWLLPLSNGGAPLTSLTMLFSFSWLWSCVMLVTTLWVSARQWRGEGGGTGGGAWRAGAARA